MNYAVAGLVLLLCLILGALAGFLAGHRRGKLDGRHDTVRKLVLAKDQECWVAAHYLEADALAEAKTVRITKRDL
jgi:hypothetical protein